MGKQLMGICMVLVSSLLYGHSPNEITYVIEEKEESWQLTVHFTQATAIKLLQEEVPELKNQTIINLEKYPEVFAGYFNRTVDMVLEKRKVSFDLLDTDLKSHDAILTFNLENIPSRFDQYDITITSFLEIYYQPKNVVKIIKENRNATCFLDKQNTVCSSD